MPSTLLLASLRQHEGLRLEAYTDTVGVRTIGYGHAYCQPGEVWTKAKAEAQLVADATEAEAACAKHLPWWCGLDPARRDVVAEMAFNLGMPGLLGFKNTLKAIEAGDYEKAAAGMLASKWARQVGQRAKTLAEQMRTGNRA